MTLHTYAVFIMIGPFERLKISLYKRDVLFVAISAASMAFL